MSFSHDTGTKKFFDFSRYFGNDCQTIKKQLKVKRFKNNGLTAHRHDKIHFNKKKLYFNSKLIKLDTSKTQNRKTHRGKIFYSDNKNSTF